MDLWILWMLCAVSLLAQESCSELTLIGCKDGRVDVVEDWTYSFTCGIYGSSGAVWTVYSDKGQILYNGFCQYTSCSCLDDNVFLGEQYFGYYNGFDVYTSSFTIKSIKRDSARILNCSSLSESKAYELRIIAIPVYTDCSVSILNWMVTGRCALRRMYSSDNNYICKWRENGNNNEKIGGFQTEPVSYTESNSRNYTEGVCSFTKPMPVISGRYTYSMRVSPGDLSFQQAITISEPHQVQLNHSCPKYIFEGSSINCSCSALKAVTPSALLVWEGKEDNRLLLANVSRQQNQEQFTCQLKWGPDGAIKENTSYTLSVAYGPSDALITNYVKTEEESERTSLTCTATDVYPSAVFQWNVTCYNQTDSGDSSTCSLNSTQKFESLAILCTASNTYYHRANASYVYILSSLGILDKERCFRGVFLFPRKHFDQGPAMSQPYAVVNKPQTQTQTQTPIRRQAGPSGDMYTITNSSGHVVDGYAEVCNTANNNTRGTEISDTHQTFQKTHRIKEPTVSLKPTAKSTITNKTNVQDLHGTGYMNVTEVPTDSGLGVYHVVPWATMSASAEPKTSEYSVPTFFEEEYNKLHFEEDRTGQEDQADNYHHLQIA